MEIKEKEYKKLKIIGIIFSIIGVIGIGAYVTFKSVLDVKRPELVASPEVGKWYRITPKEAKTSNGDNWHGLIKLGKENKVIVYFFGGGVAVDEYTAARPLSTKDGFYADWSEQDFMSQFGIASNDENNPFRDWTILLMPYSTGDFHAGTGKYEYTDLNGENKTLYHYGYTNYSSFMKEAITYVEKPDELLITGFSAGGFGTSLLSDDIITNYFPETENITVTVDSSLILYDKWHEVAENMWKTPKEISDRLVTDNITLDSLVALSQKYGDKIKILFDCSVRDGALGNYQSYFRNGIKTTVNENGDIFQEDLQQMIQDLQNNIPNIGIYIWDGLLYDNGKTNLTQHTIICGPQFYNKRFSNNKSIADWIVDAINGDVKSYGLDLVDKEY